MSNTSKTSTDTPNGSLLDTLTNVDKDQNKEQSTIKYQNEPIEGTPFWIVGNNEEGFIITLGKYRVSKVKYDTVDDCYEALETDMWNIAFNMIVSIIEMDQERKQSPNGE